MRRSSGWLWVFLSLASGAPALAATHHVDAASNVVPPDGSQAAPFRTIAEGLDLAIAGDVVLVAPGRYEEQVSLKTGVELRGSGPSSTIIDATDLSLLDFAVICADDARIEGFRLVDPRPFTNLLGAIDCSNGTSPEIAQNLIEAPNRPAILLEASQAWIHHNTIRGGIWNREVFIGAIVGSGRPVIEDNEITSNGVAIGVGYFPSEEGARIQRNVLRGRVGVASSGSSSVSLTISDNLFLPSAFEHPLLPQLGGLFLLPSSPLAFPGELDVQVVNNTFQGTEGIELRGGAAVIANNVLVNGTLGVSVATGATADIHHNDVFGNAAGGAATNYIGVPDQAGLGGNVSVAPDFVDPADDDFRLRPGSSLIDAGSNDPVSSVEDLDGSERIVDGDRDGEGVADIGAQEFDPEEELPLDVAIDLLPKRGKRWLAVAILSSDALDVPAEVDVGTLRLGRSPVRACRPRDVDRDGARDLVCRFPRRGIFVDASHGEACVRGRTLEGRKLLGCDAVAIRP